MTVFFDGALALELALAVQQEMAARLDEADIDRKRYMQVDPAKRNCSMCP